MVFVGFCPLVITEHIVELALYVCLTRIQFSSKSNCCKVFHHTRLYCFTDIGLYILYYRFVIQFSLKIKNKR